MDGLISYHDGDHAEWGDFAPGSQWKVLMDEEDSGQLVFLVKWEAGYRMKEREHNQHEKHLYILDGEFIDQNRTCTAGTYIYLRPGSEHMVHTTVGCTFLEIVSAHRGT